MTISIVVSGTLDDFMGKGIGKAGHVLIPGIVVAYVRYIPRYLGGDTVSLVLDLLHLEVETEGQGAFTNLVKRVQEKWPETWVCVKCVRSDRLGRELGECTQLSRVSKKLRELGFVTFNGCDLSFYLSP